MWRAENLPGVVQTLLTPPPRPAAERYRHELKYLISYGEKAALETRMRPILQMDPHAGSGTLFAACTLTITGTPPMKKRRPVCCCAKNTASAFMTTAIG